MILSRERRAPARLFSSSFLRPENRARLEPSRPRSNRGEESGPCRIRENDELQSLCAAINEVADKLRARREFDSATPALTSREAA